MATKEEIICVVLFFFFFFFRMNEWGPCFGQDPLKYLHVILWPFFSEAQQSDETADVTAFNAVAPLPVKADTPACMNQLDTERTGFLWRFTAESRDNQHKWCGERRLDAG